MRTSYTLKMITLWRTVNSMYKPGDVVVALFAGAHETKRRPAVILSSETYHTERPDVILGLITKDVASATASSDWRLAHWQAAGLRVPSAFRTFLYTTPTENVLAVIGHLSDADGPGSARV